MIPFLLTLFFISLLGIIIMIGRKFVLLNNGSVLNSEKELFETSHLTEWKKNAISNIKRYGYDILVAAIRIYVKSSNFLKNKYQEIKERVKNLNQEKHINGEKKEISKFLKIISEYKHKIRMIKHRIHEEENNL